MKGPTGDGPHPGDPVEVYNSYTRDWSRGFVVADATETGYRLRRMSDGTLLPAQFIRSEVRAASD